MGMRVLDDLPAMLDNPEFKASYDALEQEFAIARALVNARADADMTQAEVAGRMGVTQSSIARIESGKNISIKTIARYATAVGKPIRLDILPT
ncbi:MAG: helix-turn-helix transcriptional regulator [Bilophila sp.]